MRGPRRSTLLVRPVHRSSAGELGLADATLAYEGEPPTVAELEARLEADIERGVTGAGPHLHDVRIEAGGRDLRVFGSQGEQRVAVLSLVLAEAELAARAPRTYRRSCSSTTCSPSSTVTAGARSRP